MFFPLIYGHHRTLLKTKLMIGSRFGLNVVGILSIFFFISFLLLHTLFSPPPPPPSNQSRATHTMDTFPIELSSLKLVEWISARSEMYKAHSDFVEVKGKAVTMIQLVKHELGGSRKIIQKAKKAAADAEKREKAHMQSVAKLEQELAGLIASMGLSEEDSTEAALLHHAEVTLRAHHTTVATSLSKLEAPLQSFQKFVQTGPEPLKTLQFCMAYGVLYTPEACAAFVQKGVEPEEMQVSTLFSAKREEEKGETEQQSGVADADWDLLLAGEEGGGGDVEEDKWMQCMHVAEAAATDSTVLTEKDARYDSFLY